MLERTLWMVRLRWFAVAGLFLTPPLVNAVFGIRITILPIFIIASVILCYNAGLSFYLSRFKKNEKVFAHVFRRVDNAQIGVDVAMLALLVHFTGGLENPFIFYFVFHVIISGILLPRTDALVQAAAAALLVLAPSWLEYFGVIPHHPIEGFALTGLYNYSVYAAGTSFVFVSTLFIAHYLAASIAAELRHREQRLEQANKMLEEKDRIKSEYVLRVSHDIKGHIAAIQNCIHPVREGITGPLTGDQKNLLSRADARSEKLMAFVKSLLNLTIMKLKNTDDVTEVDLVKIAADAAAFVLPNAKAKKVGLETETSAHGCMVRASLSEMQAVLIELLSNAVRYTPAGGKVSIRVTRENKEAVAEVSDTGVGIPQAEQEKVFEEFYRATNVRAVDTTAGSSGLGLSMAKHAVERSGGTIKLLSSQGKGTTIRLAFPMHTPS